MHGRMKVNFSRDAVHLYANLMPEQTTSELEGKEEGTHSEQTEANDIIPRHLLPPDKACPRPTRLYYIQGYVDKEWEEEGNTQAIVLPIINDF